MKLPFILFVILSFDSYAQTSIEFHYNDVYIGRNFSLQGATEKNKVSFNYGLAYHVNRIDKIPYGTFIKKTAFASNAKQRLCLQLGFGYYFYKTEHFQGGLFYNNQISFIDNKLIKYWYHDTLVSNPQSESDLIYTYEEVTFGPVFSIDNVIGLTFKNKINDHIYLKTKGGIGLLFWKNTSENFILLTNPPNQGIDYSTFFSIGLGYTFRNE